MRIAIVGLGAVGEACAHVFASSEVARSLVLLNRTKDIAPAIAADLRQARSWGPPLDTQVGSLDDWTALKGCDMVVLTLGARIRGDIDRSAMAISTASILRGDEKHPSFLQSMRNLLDDDVDAVPIILVVSNPVEATVTWLIRETNWPQNRLIGLGTTVESARFSGFLAQELNVDAGSVWMDIIGEHGKRFSPLDISRLHKMFPANKIDAALRFAEEETRNAARNIRRLSEEIGKERAAKLIGRINMTMTDQGTTKDLNSIISVLEEDLQSLLAPPATRYAIAASANMVAKALRDDLNQVLTVSAIPPQELIEVRVALALPFVVGRAGLGECLLQEVPEFVIEVATEIENQVRSMSEN